MPVTQKLTATNTGFTNLHITSISLLSGHQSFSISQVRDNSGTPITSGSFACTVLPSEQIEIDVKFAPPLNNNYQDNIRIVHDGINVGSPLDINLFGRGAALITFKYTGSQRQWFVPSGVTSISVIAYGAQGGGLGAALGGKGGIAKATIIVTPHETLNIYVGGKGISTNSDASGGFNGGGSVHFGGGTGPAGTGGGASDVRRGTDLANRVIVAGGGGGHGRLGDGIDGGYGGGFIGGDGQAHNRFPDSGGKGGTQTTGGAKGIAAYPSNTDGVFGIGGLGCGDMAGGGGGGGGWYGGGGGKYAGGGGGSSYVDASGNTNKSTIPNAWQGDGQIEILY